MEMLRSSSSSESQYLPYDGSQSAASPHYFIDNFYANGWPNPKSQVLFAEEENNQVKQFESQTSMADSTILPSFIDLQTQSHPIPKLEDFFGDSSSIVHSQTETQDSSLTQIYDHHGSAYFNDHQDLKAITGFQAFSTNSGSEVDDSASIARTHQLGGEFAGHSIESTGNEFGFSNCTTATTTTTTTTNGLSLGVNTNSNVKLINQSCNEKAIVSVVDSDNCSKKIADTFDTGGRVDMKRIYGITAVEERVRLEKGVKCTSQAHTQSIGGYDKEGKAARAYDLAALKYWGPTATTNFPISNYTKELEDMKHVTKQEFIASLRRKSSGFSRGASIYRGVTRHHQQGRWQARIGRVAGNKDLYLGTFATEEEAAEAYDIAAIKFRGLNAVTNFEMNRYDVEAISKSALPIGGAAKRLKLSLETEQKPALLNHEQQQPECSSSSNSINFAALHHPLNTIPCGIPYADAAALYHQNLFHHFQTTNFNSAADSSGSNSSLATPTSNPVALLTPQQAEFFIWPHQSYN
ncbi:hypothetical protein EZV62_014651 [Acer yangbiense]|uniref:AP2/ERF domain-containing protein n=1 Tax=Acer yangbiense TaxID=1000413 RepID=A0A5C7HT92_9ROSI|nr:hypothetical protein EZV62_014651 [Acer yangbiense]